jgi:hypothetical protein
MHGNLSRIWTDGLEVSKWRREAEHQGRGTLCPLCTEASVLERGDKSHPSLTLQPQRRSGPQERGRLSHSKEGGKRKGQNLPFSRAPPPTSSARMDLLRSPVPKMGCDPCRCCDLFLPVGPKASSKNRGAAGSRTSVLADVNR